MNFSMIEVIYERKDKTKIPTSFHVSEYERNLVLKRLEKALEKLKEARREIRGTIQAVLRMKTAGDDVADQAMVALIESFTNDDNTWTVNTFAKKKMKREAAYPLLLARSDD